MLFKKSHVVTVISINKMSEKQRSMTIIFLSNFFVNKLFNIKDTRVKFCF